MSTAQERAAEVIRMALTFASKARLVDLYHDDELDLPTTMACDRFRDECRSALDLLVDDDTPGRYVVTSDEGTAHCSLNLDDDTARLVALGRAVEACRPQDLNVRVDKTISYLFDAIYATAGVEPTDSAPDRPSDSPTRPETPSDGTPVAPEPSQGDVDAVAERVAQFAANLAAVNRISYADALHAIRSVLGEGGVSEGAG